MKNRHNPRCEDFSQVIWLYLERELSEEENEQWENHLENCASCQRQLADVESTLEIYSALPQTDAPESAIQAVVARAQQPPSSLWERMRTALGSPDYGRLWRPAFPVAALGMAILVFFVLPRERDIDLTSAPVRIERAIMRLDRATVVQWRKITGGPLANIERHLAWDMRTETQSRRVAAWELFNMQKARQQQKLTELVYGTDERVGALIQWQESRNSTYEKGMLKLPGTHN